jgi:hypothetical protein
MLLGWNPSRRRQGTPGHSLLDAAHGPARLLERFARSQLLNTPHPRWRSGRWHQKWPSRCFPFFPVRVSRNRWSSFSVVSMSSSVAFCRPNRADAHLCPSPPVMPRCRAPVYHTAERAALGSKPNVTPDCLQSEMSPPPLLVPFPCLRTRECPDQQDAAPAPAPCRRPAAHPAAAAGR